MQLAVAAHACSNLGAAPVAAMPAHDGAHAVDNMDGCCPQADEAAARSALCDNHCQADRQSLDKPPAPGVAPFLAIALVSAGVASSISAAPGTTRADDLFSTRINAPPVSIRNCCFRI